MKPSCKVSKSEKDEFVGFNLNCGDEHVGHLILVKEGEKLLVVDEIEINPNFRRKGYATTLYETAARFACEDERVLASYHRLEGAHSTDFWSKQVQKGRAVVHPGAGWEGQDAYSLKPSAACKADLSGLFSSPRSIVPYALLASVVAIAVFAKKASAPASTSTQDEPQPVPSNAGEPFKVVASRQKYGSVLDAAADEKNLPRELVRGVAWVESRWNPLAKSSVGALGLMQLMPIVFEKSYGLTEAQAYTPETNARVGADLLYKLYNRANGNWPVALAAYNWGQGNVFGASGRSPRLLESQWPKETQVYVRRVLEATERGVS